MLTERIAQALALAVRAHHGQLRKGTFIPYVAHPMAVASIALELGADEDQAIAAMLHDVLEDGGPHYGSLIQAQFGDRVFALVQACTDGVPDASGAKADWGERKRAYLAHLAEAGDDVLLVSGADKLHNARAIVSDLLTVGPAVFDRLSAFELEVMYGELDGTFPNHPADPLQPANQRDLQARVLSGGFDVGLAFDGDADRVFVVDELGKGMSGSTTTALLASRFLRLNPGATILYNLICSRAVPEVIGELGGTAIRTKNGHSYMKQIMAETGAVFAGEHSGHYYFADNYRADSGLIATMGVLGEMCTSRKSLSELRKPLERYASSGEINTTVADIGKVIDQIAKDYSSFDQDHLDGLTVDCGSWWFNVRPSNTEPLLRLNLEAATRDECDTQVMALLATITAQ
jgi:phosphomannomutase